MENSSKGDWSPFFRNYHKKKQDAQSESGEDSRRNSRDVRRNSEETQTPMSRPAKGSQRRRSWACAAPSDDYLYITEALKDCSPGWRGLNNNDSVPPSPAGTNTPQVIHNRIGSNSTSDSSQSVLSNYSLGKQLKKSGVFKHQIRDASRLSSDSFQDEELEAARMRLKQAAWDVVTAQQQVDVVELTNPEDNNTTKKGGFFSRLFGSSRWRGRRRRKADWGGDNIAVEAGPSLTMP